MESWKMSIFKRQTSPCPPSYRRSFSEPAYAHSEIGASLKSYTWRGPVKSKRKKNEQAVSSLGKPLGAYRWHTHPSLRLKGGKREQLENNKGDLDEPQQQAVLPKMVGDNISSFGNEVLGTSMEKQNLVNTRSLRVPFSRSLSEPEPRSSVRFVRRWPTSVGSVESEQQGYFIRGIFSTLSNGFSRMLSLKGESTNEPVREDVKGPPTHRLSCGQSPYTDTTTWERKYCILTDSQLVLLNKEKEIPVEGGQEQQTDSTKGRCLRRTVSVPSEGQFPEYPPEGAAKLETSLQLQ